MMLVVLWVCASGPQIAAQTPAITPSATTFTTLFSFDGTDGEAPRAALIRATDGKLYGTTIEGGAQTPGRSGSEFPGADPGGMVNWSEFGFVPSGGRFNPDEQMLSPSNAHLLHKLWSFFTGCSGPICGGSSATLVNGVVYVGSYDGYVYALNAATGAKLWSFLTGGEVFSSPAVANGVVYVGSEDNNVYALNATTGAKLWNYTTGNGVDSSPAVANGVVYAASYDGNLYAFRLAGGLTAPARPSPCTLHPNYTLRAQRR